MKRHKLQVTIRTDIKHALDGEIMRLFRKLRHLVAQRAADRISQANKGIAKTADHVAKLKANHKGMLGHKHSEATKERMRAANLGKRHSPVARQRMSEAQRARRERENRA